MALGAGRINAMTLIIHYRAIMALWRLVQSAVPLSTSDPLTFVAASLILAFVAQIASVIPALRATSIDTLTALRQE